MLATIPFHIPFNVSTILLTEEETDHVPQNSTICYWYSNSVLLYSRHFFFFCFFVYRFVVGCFVVVFLGGDVGFIFLPI